MVKYNCNETTLAFFLETHLEMERIKKEETKGGGVKTLIFLNMVIEY